MTQEQVYVPKTRSQLGLPAFNPAGEDLQGSSVTDEIMKELYEACGDSPLGAMWGSFTYLVCCSISRLRDCLTNMLSPLVLWLVAVFALECVWPEALPQWNEP